MVITELLEPRNQNCEFETCLLVPAFCYELIRNNLRGRVCGQHQKRVDKDSKLDNHY